MLFFWHLKITSLRLCWKKLLLWKTLWSPRLLLLLQSRVYIHLPTRLFNRVMIRVEFQQKNTQWERKNKLMKVLIILSLLLLFLPRQRSHPFCLSGCLHAMKSNFSFSSAIILTGVEPQLSHLHRHQKKEKEKKKTKKRKISWSVETSYLIYGSVQIEILRNRQTLYIKESFLSLFLSRSEKFSSSLFSSRVYIHLTSFSKDFLHILVQTLITRHTYVLLDLLISIFRSRDIILYMERSLWGTLHRDMWMWREREREEFVSPSLKREREKAIVCNWKQTSLSCEET